MKVKKTRFTEMLIEANGLDPDDFQQWVFCPAMLFQAADKWWGDRGRRDFPHEGIDFCLYANRSGRILRVDATTRIPAMHDGVVRALFSDYLGRAVIIEHENEPDRKEVFVSAYAHTTPVDGIQPGTIVKEGDVIATIADTGGSTAKIPAHLHYTIGRPSPDPVCEPFVWNTMRDPDRITLLDPLQVIDWPCRVLDPHNRDCLEL